MLKLPGSCQVHAVIGVLMDDTDPLVTVMKVEKAPQETYADIGGLDNQIQEIKVRLGSSSGSSPVLSHCGVLGVVRHASPLTLFWAALGLCCRARAFSLVVANGAPPWWRVHLYVASLGEGPGAGRPQQL